MITSQPLRPVELDYLHRATSAHPTGVAALTVLQEGRLRATCVGTFTRLSLQPPMISVCISADGRTASVVGPGDPFGISTLSAEQAALAQTLADPHRSHEESSGWGPLRWSAESATFARSCAGFHCRINQAVPVGDHLLLVADVLEAWRRRGHTPLIHVQGSLLACPTPASVSSADVPLGAARKELAG